MGALNNLSSPLHVFCIFGSGDISLPTNHIGFARLKAVYVHEVNFEQPRGIYAFFGCHQPSMLHTKQTEAKIMEEWFRYKFANHETTYGQYSELLENRIFTHDHADVSSISTTCATIVREYLAHGHHVNLVINWPYIPRTRYLLRKQAERAGLSWRDVKHLVHSAPCGGTYLPYVKDMSALRATLWWTKKVLLREIGAWGKALLDPFSEKYNQNRAF